MVRLIVTFTIWGYRGFCLSIPKMVRLIDNIPTVARPFPSTFNSKDGAIDSTKSGSMYQGWRRTFNSKDGAIDSLYCWTLTAFWCLSIPKMVRLIVLSALLLWHISQPSFNSKDGGMDSSREIFQETGCESFNSTENAVERAVTEKKYSMLYYFQFQRWCDW